MVQRSLPICAPRRTQVSADLLCAREDLRLRRPAKPRDPRRAHLQVPPSTYPLHNSPLGQLLIHPGPARFAGVAPGGSTGPLGSHGRPACGLVDLLGRPGLQDDESPAASPCFPSRVRHRSRIASKPACHPRASPGGAIAETGLSQTGFALTRRYRCNRGSRDRVLQLSNLLCAFAIGRGSRIRPSIHAHG